MTARRSKLARATRWVGAPLLLLVAMTGVGLSVEVQHAAAATVGDQIAAFAASEAGVPYCDGGGGINGPTNGGVNEPGCGPGAKGFDCMSLVQYAVYQATGIALPGDGSQPTGVGTVILPSGTIAQDAADLLPGDATYWGGSLDGFSHSGIYAGNGMVWDAIGQQQPVQEHSMAYLSTIYSYDGAIRYWTPTPVVGMASLSDGKGYWLTDAAGGVSAYGGAVSYGSLAGHALNAPIAHIVATADGRGYWLVAADGGIFAFGDATFHGSMGGQRLNQPVVGMSADDATGGYWLVATDGGIFAFDAPFLGSTGGLRLNRPVNGMTALPDGQGYWFVASDGGVFNEGAAGFLGSMGGTALNAPVMGMAVDSTTGGYWLVASDGGVFSFDAPFYGAV